MHARCEFALTSKSCTHWHTKQVTQLLCCGDMLTGPLYHLIAGRLNQKRHSSLSHGIPEGHLSAKRQVLWLWKRGWSPSSLMGLSMLSLN